MIDIERWANWVLAKANGLTPNPSQRLAAFFTDDARASANPSFFVDAETEQSAGRMVVWSTGDFDLTVYPDGATEPRKIDGLPERLTDANFRSVFDRFLSEAGLSAGPTF